MNKNRLYYLIALIFGFFLGVGSWEIRDKLESEFDGQYNLAFVECRTKAASEGRSFGVRVKSYADGNMEFECTEGSAESSSLP